MGKRKTSSTKQTKPKFPMSFETFREIGAWERSNLTTSDPSCFNGWVLVRKYRLTVEEIEEPNEVLCQRLQALWDETTNHHHYSPLMAEAERLGYTLVGSMGNKARKEAKNG